VATQEVDGTCDCGSPAGVAIKEGFESTSLKSVSGLTILDVTVTCAEKCAPVGTGTVGQRRLTADDALLFTIGITYAVDEASPEEIPFVLDDAIAEIEAEIEVSTIAVVQEVAEETGIELVPSPIVTVVTSAEITSLSSLRPFDSTSRKFCMQVMNFRVNSVFKMRPCQLKPGNVRQKQIWTVDNAGKFHNQARPEWCMTWAGGKRKDLRLDLCANSTRKTEKYKYEATDKAIIVENLKNKKKFKIGFNTETKYEPLRLYGLNSENLSVNSFVFLTS